MEAVREGMDAAYPMKMSSLSTIFKQQLVKFRSTSELRGRITVRERSANNFLSHYFELSSSRRSLVNQFRQNKLPCTSGQILTSD